MITVSYQFIEIVALISIMINIVTGMYLLRSKEYVNSLYDWMEDLNKHSRNEDN
jgi:hypothetical protein